MILFVNVLVVKVLFYQKKKKICVVRSLLLIINDDLCTRVSYYRSLNLERQKVVIISAEGKSEYRKNYMTPLSSLVGAKTYIAKIELLCNISYENDFDLASIYFFLG